MEGGFYGKKDIELKEFIKGMKDGVPIALGYISVSFAFGIMAVSGGLTWWEALLISLTNLTSAGQFAGLNIMLAAGSAMEMAVTQLVINLRYSLMSISLSQKVDKSMNGIWRWILGFGITDEIFAVAQGRAGKINRRYMAGLVIVPVIGWSLGTFLGAVCGNILPAIISNALSVALYGMFIAIVVPNMRKDRKVLVVVLTAVLLSCCFTWIPAWKQVSAGFSVTICAVAASLVGAWLFPVDVQEE